METWCWFPAWDFQHTCVRQKSSIQKRASSTRFSITMARNEGTVQEQWGGMTLILPSNWNLGWDNSFSDSIVALGSWENMRPRATFPGTSTWLQGTLKVLQGDLRTCRLRTSSSLANAHYCCLFGNAHLAYTETMDYCDEKLYMVPSIMQRIVPNLGSGSALDILQWKIRAPKRCG